jgi:hypothetical protein
MQPHEVRMINERNELDQKLQKLKAFVETPTFETLLMEEKLLLTLQLGSMSAYYHILEIRISRIQGRV